jgi:flagellar M-ring protein FliF
VTRRFRVSGPNLKEELADMVREDPDSAAKVLAKWIGEVN